MSRIERHCPSIPVSIPVSIPNGRTVRNPLLPILSILRISIERLRDLERQLRRGTLHPILRLERRRAVRPARRRTARHGIVLHAEMVPRVRVVALSVGLRGGPDAHGAVVRACGEHEGVLGVVPCYAGEVAAEGLGADVM